MSYLDKLMKRFEERPYYTTYQVTTGFMVAFAGVALVSMVLSMFMAPLAGVTGVVRKTFESENMITQYEWFKQQRNDIHAMIPKIKASEMARANLLAELDGVSRKDWSFEDKNESDRLRQIVVGLTNTCFMMVADYNAKSDMANRSIFKLGDEELPPSLGDEECTNPAAEPTAAK